MKVKTPHFTKLLYEWQNPQSRLIFRSCLKSKRGTCNGPISDTYAVRLYKLSCSNWLQLVGVASFENCRRFVNLTPINLGNNEHNEINNELSIMWSLVFNDYQWLESCY